MAAATEGEGTGGENYLPLFYSHNSWGSAWRRINHERVIEGRTRDEVRGEVGEGSMEVWEGGGGSGVGGGGAWGGGGEGVGSEGGNWVLGGEKMRAEGEEGEDV